MEREGGNEPKQVSIFVRKLVAFVMCSSSALRGGWKKIKKEITGVKKKKKKSTCFEFIFKFSPLYNSVTHGYFFLPIKIFQTLVICSSSYCSFSGSESVVSE